MNLLLLHPPKSKSTLTTSKHHHDTNNLDGSLFRGPSFNSLATYQSLPKILLSGLLDPIAVNLTSSSTSATSLTGTLASTFSPSSNEIKGPSVAVSSLHSLSSSSSCSLLLAATADLKSFIPDFESNLTNLIDTISIISNPIDAFKLLTYYYSDLNKLPSSSELFPYAHGLDGYKQRIFFDKILNEDLKTNQELAVSLNLDEFNLQEFSGPINPPQLSNHFYLMFVSLLNIDDNDYRDSLQNTINFDDLMTFNNDATGYLPFSHINDLSVNCCQSSDLNNRNFKSQVKLAANYSHFFVYNLENDLEANKIAAEDIRKALGRNPLNQKIFILDIPDMFSTLELFLESNSEYCKLENCDYTTDETFDCKLLQWEQNLIWKVNSNKWIHPNVCIGSLIDFNRLHDMSSEDQEFKMFVNCRQTSPFPDISDLEGILNNLNLHRDNPGQLEPIYLEFPSSGNFNLSSISFNELLSFLNLLAIAFRLIKERKQKVFILCYDGFTGLSLFALCVLYLLRLDEQDLSDCSSENLLLDLLADPRKDVRLYFFKSDFLFLKHLEKSLCWIYFTVLNPEKSFNDRLNGSYTTSSSSLSSSSSSFSSSVKDASIILDLDYRQFTKFARYLKTNRSLQSYDWFDLELDNNFPSRIISNLYLGSLNHALSSTILNAYKISRIVSIGEKPQWFEMLNKHVVLECDLANDKGARRRIIKPVFTEGFVEYYIIPVNGNNYIQIPNLPYLEKIVYVHNLKDDGKDSVLPLLTEIPDSVRNEILIDPNTSKDTTLIHCRIGVSRSATIVIATLMKFFKWSLLESYMFVRVKRFNIIIQPNLKIFYELFLYEEYLRTTTERGGTRSLCWDALCNEIHKLNDHYIGGSDN